MLGTEAGAARGVERPGSGRESPAGVAATKPARGAEVAASGEVLERNLRALSATSPGAAEEIRRARARADATFFLGEDGGLTGEIAGAGGVRSLGSRRRPLDEGRRLAEQVPVESAGGVCVVGFGLGHHAAALAERMRRTGIILCHEPDTALLRAVLERADHSGWMARTNFVLVTSEDDGAIAAAVSGAEGLLALGTKILQHPADAARLGEAGERFARRFAHVLQAVRTNVVTTLVQMDVSLRNSLMNLDHYALGPGVADLAGAGAGRPAVVVSAGPSLRRNMEVLGRPGVRERVVIIATQTVLKTLLRAGIRPHFVTALDYHEISRRFYEGLTAEDAAGVTLVAETKANPAILESFPGRVRCVRDRALDTLLGEGLRREMGAVPAGATVAHLAYALARLLRCDPVILVGQDLGFTDGQYYAAGAAIHDTWAPEVNPFNTLEMMEWQRIVRSRATLRRATDHLGRAVYTDEQMATYLVQFEREFLADTRRGLRVIDATEGGVSKRHAEAMPLREAVERFAPEPGAGEPAPGGARAGWTAPEPAAWDESRRPAVVARVRRVREDAAGVARLSRETAALLREMLEHQGDRARVNRLIGAAHAKRDAVARLEPAFSLVQHLNQAGMLRRIRADRGIELDASLGPVERQRRQIERDIDNVVWLGDAADRLVELLDGALAVLEGRGERVTRDLDVPEPAPADADGAPASAAPSPPAAARARRVPALIAVDPACGGLGIARDLARPVLAGQNALRLALRRLARCRRLDGAVLLTREPERVRAILGGEVPGLDVRIVPTPGPALERVQGVRGARLWSGWCWRGGLGWMTAWDEALSPQAMAAALRAIGADSGVIVGADWALVDPELTDAVVERHLARAGRNRVAFCPAPPGLAGCAVDGALLEEMARKQGEAGAWASLGGLLGYLPTRPKADPIATTACAPAPPEVRQLLTRCVPDTAEGRRLIERALGDLGEGVVEASAGQIAARIAAAGAGGVRERVPRHLVVELCTGRRTGGLRARWMHGRHEPVERPVMTRGLFERVIRQLAEEGEGRDDAIVTLGGAGDPLLHAEWVSMARLARGFGVAGVHVRTDLLVPPRQLDALLECGAEVISVDVLAARAETYERITGVDRLELVTANLERLLEMREKRGGAGEHGIPTPWIVPRLTRCDATYGEVEAFFDHWLLRAGACVIDPLPRGVPGERIEPLPLPAWAADRVAGAELTVLSDGGVPPIGAPATDDRRVGDVSRESLREVWKRALAHRRAERLEAAYERERA